MTEPLDIIRTKLTQLRDIDTSHKIFGSSTHKYRLNPTKSESELLDFEKKYNIKLPLPYRDFLKHIGNGGAGPYYGLQPLESGLFDDLDSKDKNFLLNPSIAFPHTDAWNHEFPEDEENYFELKDKEYFDPKWISGVLRICNFGCGVFMNIVVNGQECGNIWVDDRCSDGGIYPDHYFGNKNKINFLTWYELWLDKSIEEINKST